MRADLDSVIDRRGKARKGKTDMPEYIKKTFLHYYLVDGGEGHAYSIAKCMEYTEKWAEKNAVNALPASLVQQLLPHSDGCAGGCAHSDA